jgi:3-hydroxyacyl-[acyl-carrier-protein] dehydratase
MLSDYYSINSRWTEGENAIFEVSLNPDSEVYRGHFPGMPVSPGVCNMQMVRECVEQLTGYALRIDYVAQCRMTVLITPLQYPVLKIHIRLLENRAMQIKVQASIGVDDETFFSLKFDATVLQSLFF